MSERLCEFEGCGRPYRARGCCQSHYNQLRQGKELSQLTRYVPRNTPLEVRLSSRVMKEPGDGCWIWVGAKTRGGYGALTYKNKSLMAHRASYELAVGPIPEGMELDHVCRVEACIRPDHLRVVDRSTNAYNRSVAVGTSGIRNVRKSGDRWAGAVRNQGEYKHLGTFDTAELATEAVLDYRKEHGIIIDSRAEVLGLPA